MKTSDSGRKFIEAREGLRLEAYPDPGTGGEPWTIGYGHTMGVHPGDIITAEEADTMLSSDLVWAETAVNGLVKVPLTQEEFDALVDFVFNIGTAAFANSTLLRLLNGGDYNGADAQFQRWDLADGRVLPGLLARRQAEAAMFKAGMDKQ